MKQPTVKAMNTLEDLQAIDFVLIELRLYLHTHPKDTEALQQYNTLAEERLQLKAQVEKEFGSLASNEAIEPGKSSDWNQTPWPWQL